MIGDTRALMIAALRTTPASALVEGRISTRLGTVYPQIRVTLLGGPPGRLPGVVQPEFQLECWANGNTSADERAAQAVAAATYDALVEGLLVGDYTPGVVTGCYPIGYLMHSPDPVTSRERFILSGGLLARPNLPPA